MAKEGPLEKLERIAEILVLMNPEDQAAWASLREELQGVAEDLPDGTDPAVLELLGAARVHVDGVVDGERDFQQAAVLLEEVLSTVRSICIEGKSLDVSPLLNAVTRANPPTSPSMPITLPPHIDETIFSEFLSRQEEVLQRFEELVLYLEKEADEEAMAELKRILHTLKGEAALMGLEEVETLCHETEDLLAQQEVPELVDSLLNVKDWLSKAFAWYAGEGSSPDSAGKVLDSSSQLGGEGPADAWGREDLPHEIRDYIRELGERFFTFFEDPANEEKSQALFKSFHRLKGTAGWVSLPQVEALAKEGGSRLRKSASGGQPLEDGAMEKIRQAVEQLSQLAGVEISAERIEAIEGGGRGNLTPESQDDTEDEMVLAEAQEEESKHSWINVRETLMIDAERLDRLVDVIGELVIKESMVCQSPELRQQASPALEKQLAELDKTTRELQEIGTTLRMIPLRSTFQKMARLVREQAKKAGKLVDFKLEGEDTELDKTVVDRIGDPLVHLLRNAVDHGIEDSAEERIEAGKNEVGSVTLRAFHKGGNIYIEVEDDGRGLDKEALLSKGKAMGLVGDRDTMADREIFGLIFEPGFSTAQRVTDVSGRGVGMDVVRRRIEGLRGQVDVRSSPGEGSVLTVQLPLTLAIIDGMVVRVGGQRYIIPLLSIVRSIRPTPDQLSTVLGRSSLLEVHDQVVPLLVLADLFDVEEAVRDPQRGIVVLVEDEGRQIGLLTDGLLGQQQIVMKSLGDEIQRVQGISGGAIMPDGRVGLIVDVAGLVRLANQEKLGTEEVMIRGI